MRSLTRIPFFNIIRRLCNATASRNQPSPATVSVEPSYLYVGTSSNLPFSIEPDLDFRHRLADPNALKGLLESRGYDVTRSFGDLETLARKYQEWYDTSMEMARRFPKSTMKTLGAEDNAEYCKFKEAISKLERETVCVCLRIPADLHPWTPIGENGKILATFSAGKRADDEMGHRFASNTPHMEILGSYANHGRPLVEFKHDPLQCFVMGDAAKLLQNLEEFSFRFVTSNGYRSFSPAHFIRTAMVEAYLGSVDDSSSKSPYYLPIKSIYGEKGVDYTWALNLVGHGPAPYLAFFSRKSLCENNAYPLKFCSGGMAYSGKIDSPDNLPDKGCNLFNFPTQRSRLTLWTAYDTEKDKDISDQVSRIIQELLSRLNLSFRIEQQPSLKLLTPEMSRLDFLTESADLSVSSVRLASVSSYGDFLSRRIRLTSDRANPTTGQCEYAKCCYAELDLFNILGRIYEEMGQHWPECLRVDS